MLRLVLNGKEREFAELAPGATAQALVAVLGFRADRVALERNGEIVPRSTWAEVVLNEADRLEVVHFVGGGTGSAA